MLHPTAAHTKSNNTMPISPFSSFGKRVRSYHVLPVQISSRVEGWRLEAWMRTDRRITAQDIIDRINPRYGITVTDIKARRVEFREKFHLADWDARPNAVLKAKLIIAGLNPNSNSTRGLTPGLIDPKKGEEGGRIPLPPEPLHNHGCLDEESALRLDETRKYVGSSDRSGKGLNSQDPGIYPPIANEDSSVPLPSPRRPSQFPVPVRGDRITVQDDGRSLHTRNDGSRITPVNGTNSAPTVNWKREQYFYYSSDEAPAHVNPPRTTSNNQM